jgi:hypothetical protein
LDSQNVPLILGQVNFFMEFGMFVFTDRSWLDVSPRQTGSEASAKGTHITLCLPQGWTTEIGL